MNLLRLFKQVTVPKPVCREDPCQRALALSHISSRVACVPFSREDETLSRMTNNLNADELKAFELLRNLIDERFGVE